MGYPSVWTWNGGTPPHQQDGVPPSIWTWDGIPPSAGWSTPLSRPGTGYHPLPPSVDRLKILPSLILRKRAVIREVQTILCFQALRKFPLAGWRQHHCLCYSATKQYSIFTTRVRSTMGGYVFAGVYLFRVGGTPIRSRWGVPSSCPGQVPCQDRGIPPSSPNWEWLGVHTPPNREKEQHSDFLLR